MKLKETKGCLRTRATNALALLCLGPACEFQPQMGVDQYAPQGLFQDSHLLVILTCVIGQRSSSWSLTPHQGPVVTLRSLSTQCPE